jgi:redox-sensitive bicupin YhaK (pirin superfamily)
MQTIRKGEDRGRGGASWLQSWHSFSFADYYDPAHMGFGPLRVINEDIVAPRGGFPMHGHADMEIITYVLSGTLAHEDNTGGGGKVRHGDVQVMSAGRGIMHSEFNPSDTEPVHLLQIWIMPERRGVPARYDQQTFAAGDFADKWRLVASPDGAGDSLIIGQDARLWAARLGAGKSVSFDRDANKKYWMQVARGMIDAGGQKLGAGDALAIEGESGAFDLAAAADSEVLLFELPQ